MVLVLVLAVLTISYASSLKAYFQQHSQIQQLRGQIAPARATSTELESEKQRWQDPAYVKEQARARFGYLMPGETSYVVIGADGKPLAAQATLTDPRTHDHETPTAWWTAEWRSVHQAVGVTEVFVRGSDSVDCAASGLPSSPSTTYDVSPGIR